MHHFFKTAFAALLLAAAPGARAQDIWSLERCIVYAQDANFTVLQARANVKVAALAEKQAKAARLPNISINSNAGEQFGRTIDPTTNQFNTTNTGYNSPSLNAGVPIFNGGLIHHSVKQAVWNAQAANADAEQTSNDLALMVAQAYLNILLAEEQAESTRRRVDQSLRQLNVTQKLIEAGTVPMADRFNIEAQIARDEQTAVAAQNSVDLAYLNLKQLLQLEPDYDLRIERPQYEIPADVNPENYSLQPVYATALTNQPSIRAAEFRIKSAQAGIPIARADYFPSLSLFANLSTNYSSQYRTPVFGTPGFSSPVPVLLDGELKSAQFPETPVDYKNVTYFNQLDQNFGQGIGVQISIPIYQNNRVRLSVERARLNLVNAQLQQNQTRQQLKNDIQTAIANARSARKQLDAAQKTYTAMQAAFNNTDKRHSLGAVNALELTTAKTNLDNAENDVLVAKYDYLFKLKILDFYQGKELRLK